MNDNNIYDIIGIGVGPFNLGLAALAADIPDLRCKFIDRNPSFNWHPGLLLPDTRLQVPFYADLVTLADPTNRFSFLSFLKSRSRMFSFAISENNFVSRIEYNQYCQWVAAQIAYIQFGLECISVEFDAQTNLYIVCTKNMDGSLFQFHGKHIVVGVGTIPSTPECTSNLIHPMIFHSADYLNKKREVLRSTSITLVGSGQSAAEIFYDLLENADDFANLSWLTRAEYLYPMDNSQFAYEMSTPDYMNYFFRLSESRKHEILSGQNRLYKGINADLLKSIQNILYSNRIMHGDGKVQIYTSCELRSIEVNSRDLLLLKFYHTQQDESFSHKTDSVILATGYKNITPDFLQPVKELISWTTEGSYKINLDYSIDSCHTIFVQNADLHSHGFNSADLGLGPYRNAIILNTILRTEHFKTETGNSFQKFGSPVK